MSEGPASCAAASRRGRRVGRARAAATRPDRCVRVPETRFGVSERASAGSSGGHLMLLLAVSTPPRIGRVALPVRGRERGRDTRLASRARGAASAGGPAELPPSRSGVPGRTGPDASSRPVGQRVRAAEDDPSLAPVAARAPLDVSASAARQACNRRWRPCADRAAGAGEPGLGLPPDPGRARRTRCPDRGQHCLVDPAAGRHRAGAAALIGDMAGSSCERRPSGIVACDFFTVDTVLFRRLYVLVFIELATRQVYLAGITANPTGEWATQQARNVIETFVDRAEPIRFLIHDRDSKFTAAFDEVFRSDGIRIDPHTGTGAPRERVHRTLDRHRPPRVPRPAPDRQPPPPRTSPPGLHPPLQRASPPPLPRPATTNRSTAARVRDRRRPRPCSAPRRARRTHPRIQGRGVIKRESGFRHPQDAQVHLATVRALRGGGRQLVALRVAPRVHRRRGVQDRAVEGLLLVLGLAFVLAAAVELMRWRRGATGGRKTPQRL